MLVRFEKHQIVDLHNRVPGDIAHVECPQQSKRLVDEKVCSPYDGPWPLPDPAEADPRDGREVPGEAASILKREASIRPRTRKAIAPVAQGRTDEPRASSPGDAPEAS